MESINTMPGALSVFDGFIFICGLSAIIGIILGIICIYEKVSKKGEEDEQ